MDITPDQVQYHKRVGRIGQTPVYEVVTKGGFNMILAARNGKTEPLGVGPHRAISRHIANKTEPQIVWEDLSKSDWMYAWEFQSQLPTWEAETKQLRQSAGY